MSLNKWWHRLFLKYAFLKNLKRTGIKILYDYDVAQNFGVKHRILTSP
jgi:hypothetical protein